MIVLGIESSCDETAAAVVADDGRILSNEVLSQVDEHRPYGGIVPEVAARAHADHMDHLVARAMEAAGMDFAKLDGVAATGGPGLIGGVIVGVMTAKAIASVHDLPFVAVNHLEGHALTARLTGDADFPYLLLLVSGGHCQLLSVSGPGQYRRLGTTIDDALGEAFDKVAKMLGLGYPGGPAVEATAVHGTQDRFAFPRPLKGKPGCDFSFSGLKAAVRREIESQPEGPLSNDVIADICASFQAAAGDVLFDRCRHALNLFRQQTDHSGPLVVAGGVAANQYLRTRLETLCRDEGTRLVAPPLTLCTDNAAMIAWAGIERLKQGEADGMDFAPRPRWPLDPNAPKAVGGGVKA